MKKRLLSILKFIGLHMSVGVLYVFFLDVMYWFKDSFNINIIYNIYNAIKSNFTSPHAYELVRIIIMDTVLTLAIVDKFSIFKGKFRIIKTWLAWISGIIIANYTVSLVILIYWLM